MMDALIVFCKPPLPGKVKTRLAKDIGDLAAVQVYKALLHYTNALIRDCSLRVFIYYGEYIPSTDQWETAFERRLQASGDLGQRMYKAFQEVLAEGCQKVLIIGSDCAALELTHITTALNILEQKEVVIGPAIDGGYYLLGMTRLIPALFQDKSWSTADLLKETKATLQALQVSYEELEPLSDIDELPDLYPWLNRLGISLP